MPYNHLILSYPLLLPPSIFPSIRVFFSESVLHIRWPKYWSFSFNISPSSEYSGLISFRMDWLHLPAWMCKIMLDIYATMCKTASGKLLYSTGSSAQWSVMTWRSGMEEWEGGSGRTRYLWLIHVVVQQKLAQHCKAIISQ